MLKYNFLFSSHLCTSPSIALSPDFSISLSLDHPGYSLLLLNRHSSASLVIIYLFAFILHLIACKLLCNGQHMAPSVRTTSCSRRREIPLRFPAALQIRQEHTHSRKDRFVAFAPISGLPSPPHILAISIPKSSASSSLNCHPGGKVTTFPVSISRRVPSGLHFSALAKCPQCPTSASASDFGVQSPALPSSHPWASHPFWSFFGVLLNAATCRSCCLSVPLLCCVLWFWPLESKVQPLPSATMTTRPQKLVK